MALPGVPGEKIPLRRMDAAEELVSRDFMYERCAGFILDSEKSVHCKHSVFGREMDQVGTCRSKAMVVSSHRQLVTVRRQAQRLHLLEASERLFGAFGFHRTTVPMIVAEAGCATGSFYLHFSNKEDIFAEVLHRLDARLDHILEESRLKCPDPVQRISCAVESAFLFLARNPHLAKILIVDSSGLGEQLEGARRKVIVQRQQVVRQLLEQSTGGRSSGKAEVFSCCLVGSVLETLYGWLEESPHTRVDAKDAATIVCRFIEQAICGLGWSNLDN